MTREELISLHKKLCEQAVLLLEKKNQDYSGKTGGVFANFNRAQAMGICTTEQAFLVRLTDKMSRLASFVETGTFLVKDESVGDTCIDIINYIILFYAYLQDKRSNAPGIGSVSQKTLDQICGIVPKHEGTGGAGISNVMSAFPKDMQVTSPRIDLADRETKFDEVTNLGITDARVREKGNSEPIVSGRTDRT